MLHQCHAKFVLMTGLCTDDWKVELYQENEVKWQGDWRRVKYLQWWTRWTVLPPFPQKVLTEWELLSWASQFLISVLVNKGHNNSGSLLKNTCKAGSAVGPRLSTLPGAKSHPLLRMGRGKLWITARAKKTQQKKWCSYTARRTTCTSTQLALQRKPNQHRCSWGSSWSEQFWKTALFDGQLIARGGWGEDKWHRRTGWLGWRQWQWRQWVVTLSTPDYKIAAARITDDLCSRDREKSRGLAAISITWTPTGQNPISSGAKPASPFCDSATVHTVWKKNSPSAEKLGAFLSKVCGIVKMQKAVALRRKTFTMNRSSSTTANSPLHLWL